MTATDKQATENKPNWNFLESAKPATTLWTTNFFELQLSLAAEMVRFVGQRLVAQGEYLKALAHCKSPEEFFAAQSSFTQYAIQDYGIEGSKLTREFQSTVTKDAA